MENSEKEFDIEEILERNKKWRERDWYWLLGILIAIIILLIASIYGKSKGWETNFSIISSAVSIALALVAIFIALKQDGNNQITNRNINVALARMEEKLNNVGNKVSEFSVEEIRKMIIANFNKTSQLIEDTLEESLEEEESLSKDDVIDLIKTQFQEFGNSLNDVIKPNNVKKEKIVFYGPGADEKLSEHIMEIFKKNKNRTMSARSIRTKLNTHYSIYDTENRLNHILNQLVKEGRIKKIKDPYGNNKNIKDHILFKIGYVYEEK